MYDDIPHDYHRLTPHEHTSSHHVSPYLTQYVSLCSQCAQFADGGATGGIIYGGYYIIDTADVAILHSLAYWDRTRGGAFGVCRFVADSTYKAIL